MLQQTLQFPLLQLYVYCEVIGHLREMATKMVTLMTREIQAFVNGSTEVVKFMTQIGLQKQPIT